MFTKSVSADRGLVGQPRMFGARGDWTSRRTLGGLAQASAVTQAVNALTSAGRKGVIPGSAAGRFWWRDRSRTQPWDPAVDLEKTVEFVDDLTGNPVGWQLGANLCTDPNGARPADWATDAANGSFSFNGTSISISSTSGGYVAGVNTASPTPIVNRRYKISYEVVAVTGNGVRLDFGNVVGAVRMTTGVFSAEYVPIGTNQIAIVRGTGGSASSATIRNIRVQEVINDTSWMGANLATNGGFASSLTGWAAGTGWSWSAGAASYSGNNTWLEQSIPTVVGRTYLVEATISSGAPSFCGAWSSPNQSGALSGTPGSRGPGPISFLFAATTTTSYIAFAGGAAYTLDNVTVREIPGHPIVSAVSGSGLVGSKRVNLLQRTEAFGHGYWVPQRATIASAAQQNPFGGANSFKLVEDTANNTHRLPAALISVPAGAKIIFKVFLRAAERGFSRVGVTDNATGDLQVSINLSTGALSSISTAGTWSNTSAAATAVGNGWWRVDLSGSSAGQTLMTPYIQTAVGLNAADATYVGDGVSGILVGGVDFRLSVWDSFGLPAYQRVGDGTAGVLDYDDTAGVLHLKNVTGTQAMMTLGTVDMSAGDAGVMLANVVKLSDAATAAPAELSVNAQTTAGALAVFAPNGSGLTSYGARHGGSVSSSLSSAASFPSPHVAALILSGDISADSNVLTINGVQAATSASDQGSGNLGNHRLNIAGRDVGGTASLRFTGYYIGNLPALVAGDAGIDPLVLSRELAAQGGFTY